MLTGSGAPRRRSVPGNRGAAPERGIGAQSAHASSVASLRPLDPTAGHGGPSPFRFANATPPRGGGSYGPATSATRVTNAEEPEPDLPSRDQFDPLRGNVRFIRAYALRPSLGRKATNPQPRQAGRGYPSPVQLCSVPITLPSFRSVSTMCGKESEVFWGSMSSRLSFFWERLLKVTIVSNSLPL